MVALLVFMGCGGGGSAESPASIGTANSSITGVGWLYENAAPDYFNNGPTCFLSVKVYYSASIAAADIDSFVVTAPNGWQWTVASSNILLGTSSSGQPYIGGDIYYGANPYTMPLAGTWLFQLKLKNGQISSVQKTLHEPGSSADATHQYLYSKEDWTPSTNASQYIATLSRIPAQGYTIQYAAANGGTITTTGLVATRTSFLAAEPHAYNMVCWLYDANKAYLGYTTTEFSPLDHSRTNLITSNGELSIVPASTVSSTGQIDLSMVRYLRFVYFDGAQFEPASHSNADYRSISSLVPVTTSTISLPWVIANSPTINNMHGIAWSGTNLVAVGDSNTILTSSDAINWTSQTPGIFNYFYNTAWLGTHFAAVGQGNMIITSPDGVKWTSHVYGSYNPLCGIAKSDTVYIAVGSELVLSSYDENLWTSRNTDLTNSVCGIVWSGNKFVTVGYGGKILTSSDGLNWTSQASTTTSSLNGVAWSGSKFVAVGNTGTILTSSNGTTWIPVQVGITDQLYGIIWTGKQFVAVGSNGSDYYGAGQVFTSPDGITWTKIFGTTNPQSKALLAVTWIGNRIVAVGIQGTILVSPVLE